MAGFSTLGLVFELVAEHGHSLHNVLATCRTLRNDEHLTRATISNIPDGGGESYFELVYGSCAPDRLQFLIDCQPDPTSMYHAMLMSLENGDITECEILLRSGRVPDMNPAPVNCSFPDDCVNSLSTFVAWTCAPHVARWALDRGILRATATELMWCSCSDGNHGLEVAIALFERGAKIDSSLDYGFNGWSHEHVQILIDRSFLELGVGPLADYPPTDDHESEDSDWSMW